MAMFLPLFEHMGHKPYPLGCGYLPHQCCRPYSIGKAFPWNEFTVPAECTLSPQSPPWASLYCVIFIHLGCQVSPTLNPYHPHPIHL